jgi:hypothetical protein
MSRSRVAVATTLAFAIGALAGCAGTDSPNGAASQHDSAGSESARYATDVLTAMAHNSGGAVAFTPTTLTSALPSVAYVDGDVTIRASTLVATGAFTSWKQVPAIIGTDQPGAGSISPVTQILVLTFRIDSIVASSKEGSHVGVGDSLPVEFYLPIRAHPGKVADGLVALGPAIAFLTGGFKGGTKNWSIAVDDALLGTVDSDGRITMQIDRVTFNGTDNVDGIVIDAETVADLETAAHHQRTIHIPR